MLKNMLVWIVIAVVIMSVFNNFVPQKEGSTNLSYSEFINQVKDNQIESVMIEADGKTISGTYKNGTKFLTYGLNDPKLVDDLLATGGTAACVEKMLNTMDKTVTGLAVVIELCDLQGKKSLDCDVDSIVKY